MDNSIDTKKPSLLDSGGYTSPDERETNEFVRGLTRRDNARKSPENNTGALAFMLFLFQGLKGLELDNPEDQETLDKLNEALNSGEGLFSAMFAGADTGNDSPIFRVLRDEKVNAYIREKYNVENPVEFATQARDIFVLNEGTAWEGFLDHLMHREGYRNTVYADSLGKPTVGVGHLVKPGDNLVIGQRISDAQVMQFLKEDASSAWNNAIKQAKEMGIDDEQVIIGLASVNYQLGTGWRDKFPKTWADMKDGNFEAAYAKVENSKWNRQTPVRVDDFQKIIERAAHIRDNKIEAVALNSTKSGADTQVASAKTGLSAEHEKTLAAGGVKESTPPASGTEEFTLAMSKGGTDEVAKTAALAANAPVYDVPPLLARPAQMGQTA